MRLTETRKNIIKSQVAVCFGSQARIWLFGSRVDDQMHGGDIDLYIETRLSKAEAFQQEQQLYAALQRELGEQRIDIVTHSEGMMLQPIHHEYIDSPVEMLEALRQAREFVAELSNTRRVMAEYAQQHLKH